MGYRNDSIAISRDMGLLRVEGQRALGALPKTGANSSIRKLEKAVAVLSDGPTMTTTIVEFISRGPFFIFGYPRMPHQMPLSTQWNTEKTQRFFI